MWPKALLQAAFVFDCPKCSKENFIRPMREELTDEEHAEMVEEFGEGCFIAVPIQVECRYCGSEFATEEDS